MLNCIEEKNEILINREMYANTQLVFNFIFHFFLRRIGKKHTDKYIIYVNIFIMYSQIHLFLTDLEA